MKITTTDAAQLHLEGTPTEICMQLRAQARMPGHTHQEYMAQVASRVKLWSQHTISTRNAHQFLTDLATAGLITIEEA